MPLQGEVAGAPVAHRQAVKAAREHVHLARQIDLHDALLAAYRTSSKSSRRPAEPAIEAGHRRLAARDRQRSPSTWLTKSYPVRAGDRPVGQPLVARQDLLDDDIACVAGALRAALAQ